ncbi:MAG: nicotinate-nucleotide adenylyltransferase [Cyanobacteria bacterium P01_A01_bin.123]
MTRIALFGTSADPPHQGHQAILTWLAHRFDHVAVWAADNPFKQHQTSLEKRSNMLDLLIQNLPVPHQNVQLHRDLSHQRTVITIERAREIWPDAQLVLVVGADLVKQLPRWYRSTDILQQVNVLVFPRPGYAINSEDLAELRNQGAAIAIANMPELHDVSSTRYRQNEEASGVPTFIRAYIHQNDLYPCAANSRETLPTR